MALSLKLPSVQRVACLLLPACLGWLLLAAYTGGRHARHRRHAKEDASHAVGAMRDTYIIRDKHGILNTSDGPPTPLPPTPPATPTPGSLLCWVPITARQHNTSARYAKHILVCKAIWCHVSSIKVMRIVDDRFLILFRSMELIPYSNASNILPVVLCAANRTLSLPRYSCVQ